MITRERIHVAAFSPSDTVHVFTRGGGMWGGSASTHTHTHTHINHTNLLYADTNTHWCSRTNMSTPSQTPQCLVQNGLIAGLITKETSIKRAPGRD